MINLLLIFNLCRNGLQSADFRRISYPNTETITLYNENVGVYYKYLV